MVTEAAILPVDFYLQCAAVLQEQDTRVESTSIVLSNKKLFQAIAAFLKSYHSQIVIFMLALLLTAGITLSIGHGLRLIIDQGLVDTSLTSLNTAISFVIVAAILMAIGTSVRFYLISWLGERVSADIRVAVFNHVVSLHPAFFETNRSGDIMSRLTADTTLLQSIIGSSLSIALRSGISFLGALVMLLITNITLTLVVFVSIPLVLLPILYFGNRVRVLSRLSQDSIASVGSYAGEVIQQIKTVQSFTQETLEKKAFGSEVERAFSVAKRRIRQRTMLTAMVILAVFGALATMVWFGGRDVISGEMSGGDLGAFIFYAVLMAVSVASLSEVYGELQRAVGAAERLMELLRTPSKITSPAIIKADVIQLAPALKFSDLTFYYPSRPNQAALNNFSLTISEGKVVALVGPSGAGKSTLFALIQRFYDPQQGRVDFGGAGLSELDLTDLRKQIAVVEQQPTLFTGDVMYNIRYGKLDATDQEVFAAAKAAHADDFIGRLPNGYASDLGEQGVRLSGGQRQRIAIARALLKDPRVLLLDEATSALDSESERKVQLALDTLMKGRTTVIIAHRLATILHADEIVVMKDGRNIAAGSHQSLLNSNSLYARLAKLQFASEAS
jgi:ATP-binding cassette subfamily B protein